VGLLPRDDAHDPEGRRRARGEDGPTLHIKAFTAVEVVHLAKIAKKYKRDDRKAASGGC
jgi:hypothetical protein